MRWTTPLLLAGLAFLTVCSVAGAGQLKVLPGSAERGEKLLVDKGCVTCHALNGSGGTRAADLSRTPPRASSPELLAGAMWNHATDMRASAGSGRSRLAKLNSRLTSRVAALQNTNYPSGLWEIRVGPDDQIRWFGPSDGKIYVRVDGGPPELFASGANGTTNASFMTLGHLYVFILLDQGTEIARAVKDLR